MSTTSDPQLSWSRSDLEAVCCLPTLIESRLAQEISLIGHRMTWLVVSESFMFSAYAVILSDHTATNTGNWLLWILPALGVALVGLVWPAVLEADKCMKVLGQDRDKIHGILEGIAHLGLTRLGEVRDAPLHKSVQRGRWPLWVPPVLAAVWAIALAARIGIRIGIVIGPR